MGVGGGSLIQSLTVTMLSQHRIRAETTPLDMSSSVHKMEIPLLIWHGLCDPMPVVDSL